MMTTHFNAAGELIIVESKVWGLPDAHDYRSCSIQRRRPPWLHLTRLMTSGTTLATGSQ